MARHAKPVVHRFQGRWVVLVIALFAGAFMLSPVANAAATLDPIQVAQAQLSNCQLLAAHSAGSAQRTRAQQCVADQTAILRLLQPQVTPSTTPPVATTPPVTPTTPPVTTPPATSTPPSSGFPDATNTGVPAGITLTAWTGSCNITTANLTIDAKTITCAQLTINAAGVNITRSRIVGAVGRPEGLSLVAVNADGFLLTDSDVVTTVNSSGVDGSGFTMLRDDVSGGNRGSWCSQCLIQDSFFHGNQVSRDVHASGLRADQSSTFVHNSIVCDMPGTFCSADLTGYPDFEITRDWTIKGNYFGPAAGSFWCAYGGNTNDGKPFFGAPGNATNIKFMDNVFARGTQGTCAAPAAPFVGQGWPIADFDLTKPGAVWSNNRYTDGVLITP